MEALQTYEVWREEQAQARANGWKYSNCFLLPAEMRRKMEAGVLSVHRVNNGLFLLEDAGSFYRCYYYISTTERPGALCLDREAVAEFPFAGALNPDQRIQIERLTALGFVLGRESGLMSCEAEHVISRRDLDLSEVRAAHAADAPEIAALLERSFDPRFAFLPTAEELAQAAEDEKVLAVFRDGRLAAALVSGFEKTVATVRQVAVDTPFRGMGLGKCLLEAYHRRYAAQATAFRHWVDLHNAPALAMYRGFGYGFSLRRANEYILTPNK